MLFRKIESLIENHFRSGSKKCTSGWGKTSEEKLILSAM